MFIASSMSICYYLFSSDKWHLRQFSVTSTRRPRNNVRLPSARNISNVVHSSTTQPKPDNDDNIALALFYFMQFIDHDLAKTPEGTTHFV
jgi:hypothetical protein